jgi:hypothetical protein
MKRTMNIIYPAFALGAIACLALSPQARAACQQGCDLTSGNTFLGDDALANNVGALDTAVGASALRNNTTGSNNTAIGFQSLNSNTTGGANTAVGFRSLFTTRGSFNIAIGNGAGANLTTGTNNIDIGNPGVTGESNAIRIGKPGTQTATFIAGISGATAPTGVTVIVDAFGHLGTMTSSARYKQDVQPMDNASESILALKPVTFHYKHELDPEGNPQFGLVAEEVEKVNPDLVARDNEGKPYSVRYEAVNAMLLNEFLKEHQKVEKQSSEIAELRTSKIEQQKQIDVLRAALQQQATEIRKVSDELHMKRAAARIVIN